MDIEGILGIGGFWLCMILLIFRGAIRERLVNAPAPANKGEIAELKARLLTLEARVTAMNGEILELQEVQDFDRQLLGKNERKTATAIGTAAAVSPVATVAKSTITASPFAAGRQ